MNSNRRKFLQLFGIGAGIAATTGLVGTAAAATTVKKIPKDVLLKLGDASNTLNFNTTYGEVLEQNPRYVSFGKNYVPGTEKRVSLEMKLGPDGHLYLNNGSGWRRIVTET